jgi:hypothetical protein
MFWRNLLSPSSGPDSMFGGCLLLSFHFRSKNVKNKIYKTIILSVVLHVFGAWTLLKVKT